MNKLIDANVYFLQQAGNLLEQTKDASYAQSEEGFYNSSIGAHLRHCLEHYECFANGLTDGKINYDARQRDELVETQTRIARERIDSLTEQLQSLRNHPELEAASQLEVRMDCGENRDDEADGSTRWQTTTVGRELQFLVSHTVHHFAMIKGICVNNDMELCNTFGVAPSTLKHREAIEQQG